MDVFFLTHTENRILRNTNREDGGPQYTYMCKSSLWKLLTKVVKDRSLYTYVDEEGTILKRVLIL